MLFAQKKSGPNPDIINKATRLFFGLADLDYESGYNDYIYFQYPSNNKNNVTLLDTYHFKEIFDKYIVWMVGKSFTVINYLSEVYELFDAYEYFINIGLYKSYFSLCLLGLIKKNRVKKSAISSVKKGYHKLKDYLVQPNKEASLITAKYKKLEVGNIKKGFINLQARSLETCPIFLFVKSNMRRISYIVFFKAIGIIQLKDRPIQKIVNRITNVTLNPYPLFKLSEKVINNIIIIQVKSLSHIKFSAYLLVAILDETNAILYQMNSDTNAWEPENAMYDILTLTFLKAYHGYKNIHAEFESAHPNNLPIAIKDYHEWNKNIISYKLNQSPAIILYFKNFKKYGISNAMDGSEDDLFEQNEKEEEINENEREIVNVDSDSAEELDESENDEL
ncbi:hypothetical protein C1645_813596 [Glomus cerebriforme]|uniref:Uncharacterized protein n=1 Tax=Glomus cerebriforme TaxID=658196 RepID=A0A397TI08_9GLOM|nr:hypothetical protein C1645_813596 [Glomus cerebriforme]